MIWLTFAIGLLNVGLGYAVAVHLGYGPPNAWGPLAWLAPHTAGAAAGAEAEHAASAVQELVTGPADAAGKGAA
jgi:hypothetical protein